jgi:hypothetical protein
VQRAGITRRVGAESHFRRLIPCILDARQRHDLLVALVRAGWPIKAAESQEVGARACQYVPMDPGNMQSGIYVNVCFDSIAISMNAAENQNKKSHLTPNQMNVIQHSKSPGPINRLL